MQEYLEAFITSARKTYNSNNDILFSVIQETGDLIYANQTFLDFAGLNSEKLSDFNILKHANILSNEINSIKISQISAAKKASNFSLIVKDEQMNFILSPHYDKEDILQFLSLTGIKSLTTQEKDIEQRSIINSLNKQNSDLLELIEQLSLKNIELAKDNDKLEAELESKDKFFSVLSHDLRGQMGNMINSSDLLVHSFDDLDFTDIRSILLMLNKSIHKNYSILDNLLLWASFERKKIDLKQQMFLLNDILANVQNKLESKISKKNISIEIETSNDLEVFGDLKYIEIALENVISNAVKFSYKGQKIVISNNIHDNSACEIVISDSGIGFDPVVMQNLFKIDKIHSNYGTEKETGSGLGLLVTKKIIDEHDGELNIVTNHNIGSSVSFVLKRLN